MEYEYNAAYLRAWFIAFCVTVTLELPVVTWLARRAEPRRSRRIAVAFLGNALSHPVVWFLFPALGLTWGATAAIAETWAWLLEAALYRYTLSTMAWPAALGTSLAANSLSFGFGLLLAALGLSW